ncbi:MAG: GNAT family N-acetyltransferase [Bifidobacteriaceae bacterium]|nr:GNAT family N-acetyltransferase [Bifidobacteriaceae bacterium]
MEHEALQQLVGALEPSVRQQALDLARQVREHDGVEAISEAPLLALSDGDPFVTHILAWKNGELAGYSQRDAEGASAELAVIPGARRLGLAKAIVRTLATDTPQVRLWAHGDLGAARMVADSVGLVAVRELWEMTSDRGRGGGPAGGASAGWPLDVTGGDSAGVAPAGGEGVAVPAAQGEPAARFAARGFNPSADRAAWIDLNSAAFAGHPEQGKMRVEDLDRRMAEAWFDPAGLLFAVPVRADGSFGAPVGYVWTKIVDGIGEIYAIGVHPAAQGRRLGTWLLGVGLDHMERLGITEVRLFVEADNAPAIASYRRQGFVVTRRDIQYAFPEA